MNIGLYFGSFNPIHIGHVQIAQAALEQFDLDEVWLMVSPQNPFKETRELAPEQHRFAMAEIACDGVSHIRVCDFEFSLPRPSFTINTVKLLHAEHPDNSFYIIMGEDNIHGLHQWKDVGDLLGLVQVIVYPRTTEVIALPEQLNAYKGRIHYLSGNIIPVSATQARKQLKVGTAPKEVLHPGVLDYIHRHHLYT